MNALSTVISLIIKLLGKIFRAFGINGILTIMFVVELIVCIAYASEEYDYDSNRRDYRLTEIESVEKLDKDDPLLKEWDLMVSDHDNHYLIRIKVDNLYSESLMVPSMSAETEDGEMVVIRRNTYYENDLAGHSAYSCIPEGTQAVISYVINISDYKLEETEAVRLYEFSGDENQSILVPLPK